MRRYRDATGAWKFPIYRADGTLTGHSRIFLVILGRWYYGIEVPF